MRAGASLPPALPPARPPPAPALRAFPPPCRRARRALRPPARRRRSFDHRVEDVRPPAIDVEADAAERPVGKAVAFSRVHVSPPSVDFQMPLPGPPPFMQHAVRRR